MQPEEDPHLDLHTKIEDDVRSILSAMFEDPLCRVNVLLRLVYEEFMALDDVDDVDDVSEMAEDLMDIIMSRAMKDMTLFNTVGNA